MKQTNFSRRVKLTLVAIVISVGISAQTTMKHTVKRGETIESIAQTYGVTTEAIIEKNPDAAQFVYVGMELVIPVKSEQTEPKEERNLILSDSNSHEITTMGENGNSELSSYSTERDKSKWGAAYNIEFGFLRLSGDGDVKVRKESFAYRFTAGFSYNICDNWYVGAEIGWREFVIDITPKGSKTTEAKIDCVALPLCLGYSFNNDSWLSLNPYFGIEFNYAIKGKSVFSGETMSKKVDDVTNTRFGAIVSAGINICRLFNVSYNYELSNISAKKTHFRYLAIGLGTRF